MNDYAQGKHDALEAMEKIVEFERVSFWESPELERQTKINNAVVDNILTEIHTLKAQPINQKDV